MGQCLVCKLYDPEGLGKWINRGSLLQHLKSQTHNDFIKRRAKERRQQQEDDARRNTAYAAPRAWSPVPAVDPAEFERFAPTLMFGQPSSSSQVHTLIPDKFGPGKTAPVFNLEMHRRLLQEEVQGMTIRAEEEEIGLWDEEDERNTSESDSEEAGLSFSHFTIPHTSLLQTLATNKPMHLLLLQNRLQSMPHGQASWYFLRFYIRRVFI